MYSYNVDIKQVQKEKYLKSDYDEFLDEIFPEYKMGNLTFYPSRILKELDPTAYDCGFDDFQEYEDVYECPICEEQYESEDAAYNCRDSHNDPEYMEKYEDYVPENDD